MTAITLDQKVISLLQEHRAEIIGIYRVPTHKPGRYGVSASTGVGQQLVLRTDMDVHTANAYRDEAEDCLISARAGQEYPDPDRAARLASSTRRPHVTRGMPLSEEGRDSLRMRARRAFNEMDRDTTLKEIARERLLPLGVWKLIGAGRLVRAQKVYWHRLGLDKRGYPHKSSFAHYQEEPGRTLCGHPIPSSETHVVTRGGEGGPLECRLCAALRDQKTGEPPVKTTMTERG